MNENYLRLFNKNHENENLNENEENQQWENLSKPKQNQWEKLNEVYKTPQQYEINENLNDGWGAIDFQIETRINGVPQQHERPFHYSKRNKKINNLNGLNQYIDEDNLNEVVKYSNNNKIKEDKIEVSTTPVIEDFKNVDLVSVEMFENMNLSAMIYLKEKIQEKFI